jgi:hypothetical protein
MPHHL